jgi:hypothetical protein
MVWNNAAHEYSEHQVQFSFLFSCYKLSLLVCDFYSSADAYINRNCNKDSCSSLNLVRHTTSTTDDRQCGPRICFAFSNSASHAAGTPLLELSSRFCSSEGGTPILAYGYVRITKWRLNWTRRPYRTQYVIFQFILCLRLVDGSGWCSYVWATHARQTRSGLFVLDFYFLLFIDRFKSWMT